MNSQNDVFNDSAIPFILVDGSSYLFRAFHALPPLTTSSGQPTGAIKGVANMLQKLINTYQPTHMAVIFDAKGPTFRNDIYSEYKANRPPMPDELRSQIEPLHALVKALGLPLIMVPGVEADDVIGTLAIEAKEKGYNTLISTGDKDMAQLVNEKVTLFNSMTDTTLDRPAVEKKFGVPPELIIDYLALMGDKSDNIPGAPGVGEKTALHLLQGIGGIESLYNNLEKIETLTFRGAKSMAKKLETHREQVELSYRLATIKLDVELPADVAIESLTIQEPQKEQLMELYSTLEFKAQLRALQEGGEDGSADVSDVSAHNQQEPIEYDIVTEQKQLDQWVERLKATEAFAFDTETTSLHYMEAELVGISLALYDTTALTESAPQQKILAAYIPVAHDYPDAPAQLPLETVIEALKPIWASSSIQKIGQNLKYDISVLAKYDVDVNNVAYDTMLESYLVNSTATRHDLDTLALKYLNHTNISFETVAGKGKDQVTFNKVAVPVAAEYAVEDAVISLRLHERLWAELSQVQKVQTLFRELEVPLVSVLAQIERNGALIDTYLLNIQSQELADKMADLEVEAHELAGEPFNLSSTKQLGEILFEKLKIPVVKKTPKGAPSTAEPVLQELSHNYPLPKLILEYRSYSKLKSTYTEKLPKLVHGQTGRVHTSYHQAVTATGRLSSSDPNLQNIPVRTAEGRRIRQAFIAPKGSKILAADYSQIELRIMAHLSEDGGLLSAFRNGQDIHAATAAEVFSVPLEEVTADYRRSAKAINFGLIYGMSAFGLARQLGIPRYDAQSYIDLYFERYPGVKAYMDSIRASAHEQGYVETLYGRRLYLPEINARNKQRQQAAERTAINAPMQGTAADIIKRAMLSVSDWLKKESLKTLMIMQVHDELVFEVPEDELERVTDGVKRYMESAGELNVPLVVDVGVGNNWDEAH